MTRKIAVDLPGELVWELWGIAEKDEKSVAQIIGEALEARRAQPWLSQGLPKSTADTHAQVIVLVNDGLDDGDIAAEIGKTRGYVAGIRRRYGLKPNRRKA